MADTVSVTLPPMGESVSEGTVSRWLKAVGDAVREGEALVEVTTDKVDVEVPAPVSGRLEAIAVAEGDSVDVGGTLATIAAGVAGTQPSQAAPPTTPAPAPAPAPMPAPAAAGGEIPSANGGSAPVPAGTPERTDPAPVPAPTPDRTGPALIEARLAGAPAGVSPQRAASTNGNVATGLHVSPLARRAAALTGVDPSALLDRAPGGVVRRADVASLVAGVSATPAVSAAPPIAPSVPVDGEVTQLRGPAAALVQYMEQSRELPTATSFRTLEVGTLDERRRQLNAALRAAGRTEKVSFTHLIGYAVAQAALRMPAMSSYFARDAAGKPVRVQPGVHLGLAVDMQRKDGTRLLVVPVIRDAAAREFAEFRTEYERLVAAARSSALSADELKGASITLTNPGGLGTIASVPRLMPGQGTIVALGAIDYPPGLRQPRRELIDLGVAKVMTMTSTYDHRIIQGAVSGEFLGIVEQLLGGEHGFWEQVFLSLALPAPVTSSAPPAVFPAVRAPGPADAPQRVASADAVFSARQLYAVAAGMSLVKAHRTHGHLGAHLDPLGTEPSGDPAMEPATVHLTEEDMRGVPAEYLRVYVPGRTLAEVVPNLRKTYCGTIAYEIEHISSHEQRVWLREHIESGAYRLPLTPQRRLQLLHRLTKVDAMERYLRRTFLGQKTFSIEGLDVMVPMLEELLAMVADDNIGQVVMGMAHRGRLAVICHVVNRPYESVLQAFEKGEQRDPVMGSLGDVTGDVKYHLGATGTYITEGDRAITVRLLPNPSHLEAVNPVIEGWVRAEQTRRNASTLHVDPTAALPLLIHGDAAFSGQGVVSEVLNLQSLHGYSTGGTVHIISNNQIGFTTDPSDGRSTRYASDLAKGFDVPIIHVNADDVEACIQAIRTAYGYRRQYHRDVVVDLVGYRRFGHNEADEPNFTQPVMYQRIKAHPTVREVFVDELVRDAVITRQDADQLSEQYYARVAEAHQRVKSTLNAGTPQEPAVAVHSEDDAKTTVAAQTLRALNEQLLAVPEGFTVNPKLLRQFERRREAFEDGIEWATAEALAFASLLLQGRPLRLTGQDSQRGTFSQRHLVLHDSSTGSTWTPMLHLVGSTATFELHNSPLSEMACVGFEYGYSAATPDTLVMWEAQFGDFVNNAQGIIDQFISSGSAKWEQQSRLTLLLPHGYEGMGPEHSNARLERFLALAAWGNMRVAYPSTASQYFHLLRSQALSPTARPLVVMTLKGRLRSKDTASTLEELSTGHFRRVIDDPLMAGQRDQVQTLLLCAGKIYHDLVAHPLRAQVDDLAIARVELLHPLPIEQILEVIRGYPRLEQIFWVQEEPSNMGSWPHVARPLGRRRPYELRWDYIGRPRRSSSSEGYNGAHIIEQERILSTALSMSRSAQARQLARSEEEQHVDGAAEATGASAAREAPAGA